MMIMMEVMLQELKEWFESYGICTATLGRIQYWSTRWTSNLCFLLLLIARN